MYNYGEVLANIVTVDELTAMTDSEFTYCQKELGQIKSWSINQLEALAAKAKQVKHYTKSCLILMFYLPTPCIIMATCRSLINMHLFIHMHLDIRWHGNQQVDRNHFE